MPYAFEPEVELLRRQILQAVEFHRLVFPSGFHLKEGPIQNALVKTVFVLEDPPGSHAYRYRVLKKIFALIENACVGSEGEEISDGLVSCLGSLLEANPVGSSAIELSAPKISTLFYSPPRPLSQPMSDTIRIKEAANFYAGAGTTGHRTWEAALHLGHFLCQPGYPVVSKRTSVLELGAGRGLVSYICADVCRARKVIPTDGTVELVDSLKAQPARRAGSGDGCCYWDPQVLDWDATDGDGPGSLRSLGREALVGTDVVLGTDVTFDKRMLQPLAKTLAGLIQINPAVKTFIAATRRNEETLDSFRLACNRQEMMVKEVPFICPDSAEEQTGYFHTHDVPITIFEIWRPKRDFSDAQDSHT